MPPESDLTAASGGSPILIPSCSSGLTGLRVARRLAFGGGGLGLSRPLLFSPPRTSPLHRGTKADQTGPPLQLSHRGGPLSAAAMAAGAPGAPGAPEGEVRCPIGTRIYVPSPEAVWATAVVVSVEGNGAVVAKLDAEDRLITLKKGDPFYLCNTGE